jgi:prepilin-type N-terminal cleavage/methylation domain-containing protein
MFISTKRIFSLRNDGRRQRGFTLLELLVTMTILSAMAAMMFGAFRMSVRFWERGDLAIEGSQRFRIMTQLFRKQFGCAYALDVRNQPVLPGMGEQTDPNLQQALQNMQTGAPLNTPVFLGNATEVRFLSVYPLRLQENAGLNVIYYFVRPMPEGGDGMQLVEAETLYLNRAMLVASERVVPQGQEVVVFDHLQEVKFEYLEVNPLNKKTAWQSEWSSERMQSLPAAVALDLLFLEDVGKMGKKHRLIVPIFSQPFRGRGSIGNPNLFRN